MKIHCYTGLADRLSFIFSYLKKANDNNDQLVVCWRENDHCNGHFLDIFEPVPNVTFTSDLENCDVTGWLHSPEHSAWNIFLWNGLCLKKKLKEEVNKLRSKLGYKYAAVHVRRTEAEKIFGNSITPDKDFFKFVEKHEKVFLATDSTETQKIYQDKFKDKIVCSSQMKFPKTNTAKEIADPNLVVLRETSLEIAAIDLFTCIHSKWFMGTNHSGYSKFIERFRKYKSENNLLI